MFYFDKSFYTNKTKEKRQVFATLWETLSELSGGGGMHDFEHMYTNIRNLKGPVSRMHLTYPTEVFGNFLSLEHSYKRFYNVLLVF